MNAGYTIIDYKVYFTYILIGYIKGGTKNIYRDVCAHIFRINETWIWSVYHYSF